MTIRYFMRNFLMRVIYLIVFYLPSFLNAQNDTLVINNEDRIIGEILKMDKGFMYLDADYGDETFKIDWKTISFVKSNRSYLVLLSNGNRINFDSIEYEKKENSFILKNRHNSIIGDSIEIVFMRPVEDKFISRFDADVSAGFNYTKSTSLRQLSIIANAEYNSKYWTGITDFSYVLNSQKKVNDTYRTELDTRASLHLNKNYFLFYGLKFLSVSELNLNLRITNKIGVGRYFIRNNIMYFAAGVGVTWNNETYHSDYNVSRNSGEIGRAHV